MSERQGKVEGVQGGGAGKRSCLKEDCVRIRLVNGRAGKVRYVEQAYERAHLTSWRLFFYIHIIEVYFSYSLEVLDYFIFRTCLRGTIRGRGRGQGELYHVT